MDLHYDDIYIHKKKLIGKGKLSVEQNTISIICGKNGSGKTLLLKNIANNSCNLTSHMALLDQDNYITLSSISILESISMDDTPQIIETVKDKLEKLEFEYLLDLNNGRLSGGEQRIINILRCVCCDSEIILMDEPTNDLDFNMVEQVIHLLNDLKKKKTIIIVSHDDRLFKIADNIFEISTCEVKRIKGEETTALCNRLYINHNEARKNRKENRKFLSKLFKYNYVNLLSFLVLTIIVFMQASSYKQIVENYNDNVALPDNQLILCSIYSDTIEYCDTNKVLPIFAVESLMSLNPLKNIDTIKQINSLQNKANIELYDINLNSSNIYKAYPIEYISKEDSESINILAYYKENDAGKLRRYLKQKAK